MTVGNEERGKMKRQNALALSLNFLAPCGLVLVIAGCDRSDFAEDKLVRVRAETLSGTHWVAHGTNCQTLRPEDDRLVQLDNQLEAEREKIIAKIAVHNEAVIRNIRHGHCEG